MALNPLSCMVAKMTPEVLDSSPPGTAGDPHNPITVLLADDHALIREILAETLNQLPEFRVVGQATNGAEALELARRLRPDVVVMDVSMPVVNGLAATQRISMELPKTRIVGLSMHPSSDMARSMEVAGATAYLSKDETLSALVEVIRLVAKLDPKN